MSFLYDIRYTNKESLEINLKKIREIKPEDVTDNSNKINQSLLPPMSTLMALNPLYDIMNTPRRFPT